MDAAEGPIRNNTKNHVPPDHDSARSGDSIDSPLKDYEEEAHSFLRQHGGQIHEILGADSPDPPQGQMTFSRQPTLDESSVRHVELFQEAVRVYQRECQDKKMKHLELKEDTTWAEVLKLAQNAEKAYQDAGGKRMRSIGRWITNNSEVAVPYLRCIPNDPFYTNILSGGLKIVFELTLFQAASRISQNRDNVLEVLLRIPDAIEQAERCVILVPSDPILHDRTLRVFLTALAAIEGTVKWLRGTPMSKALNSLLRGTRYTKPLAEKKQDLERALSALEEYLTTLHTELLVENGKSINSVRATVDKAEEASITIDATTQKTLRHVESINTKFDASADQSNGRFHLVEESMKNFHQAQSDARARIEDLNDIEEAKRHAREAMKLVLVETARNAEWRKKQGKYIRGLKKEMRILQATAAAMTPGDLLKIIDGGLGHRDVDMQSTVRACEAADLPDYETATRVVQDAMLLNWLHTDDSVSLFIEGGPSMSGHGRSASPLSNASSILIKTLDEDPVVPIWFFCGAHSSPRDPWCGPQGLMRSLISQVLNLFPIKLDFISTPRYRQQLESRNLYTLCDCFEKLIRRVEPPSIVICVIDEICTLEKPDWAEGCKNVLSTLQALLDDEEVSILFKLLVTSSDRSRYAATTFPSECCLRLSNREGGARDVATERQIHLGSQRTRQRPGRKHTIEEMRKRCHTGIVTDTSDFDSHPDNAGDESESSDSDTQSRTKRQRVVEQNVVDRTVERE